MFRWLRNLFRSSEERFIADMQRLNAETEDQERIQGIYAEEARRIRELTAQLGTPQIIMNGGPGGTGGMAGVANHVAQMIAHDQFQQGIQGEQQGANLQAQQQMAAQEQAAFAPGTYGQLRQEQLRQQQPWNTQAVNIMFGETYETLIMELKANGMPDPGIKNEDILIADTKKIKEVINKLTPFARGPNGKFYSSMIDGLLHLGYDEKITCTGEWGYDDHIQDYLVKTSWSRYQLPLSCFIKLPRTIEECIEVMEKGLWSSRKSPITKKDIQ
jgi:hypothetical protein